MRTRALGLLLTGLLVASDIFAKGTAKARGSPASGSIAEEKSAKLVSDSFMADLIADRISDAIDKYGDQQAMGREVIESQFIRSVVKTCGRPVEISVENGGIPVVGEHLFADGHKRHTFSFFYSSRTTRQQKGTKGYFRFHVTVEADENGHYFVTGFGCCCSRGGTSPIASVSFPFSLAPGTDSFETALVR